MIHLGEKDILNPMELGPRHSILALLTLALCGLSVAQSLLCLQHVASGPLFHALCSAVPATQSRTLYNRSFQVPLVVARHLEVKGLRENILRVVFGF